MNQKDLVFLSQELKTLRDYVDNLIVKVDKYLEACNFDGKGTMGEKEINYNPDDYLERTEQKGMGFVGIPQRYIHIGGNENGKL